MSNGINKVTLIGNLGRDVETRYLDNGNAVASLAVATSETWRDKQSNEKQEKTEWHNVTAFGKLAEVCAEYLRKGSKIYIEGKLQTDKYEKDGVTKYSTKVIAREMRMLDSKGGQQSGQAPQQQSQPQRQAPAQGDQQYHDEDFDDDIPF